MNPPTRFEVYEEISRYEEDPYLAHIISYHRFRASMRSFWYGFIAGALMVGLFLVMRGC